MKSRPMSLAAMLFAIVVAAAGCNTGGGQSPTTGATTGGGTSPSADGSAASPSADGTDEESASPDDSGSPSTGGDLEASGDIFAFGVTREQADEIATVRIDHFEEKYPDVNLTVSETDFSPEGFLAALASDDPPDVVRIGRDVIGTYVARDTLLPLDDCMTRAGLDPSLFYESPLNAVTIDGQVYGIPEAMDTRNWLVNNAAFEDAGLDPENFDWSDWDAIRSAAEAMFEGEGNNITRIGIDPKIPEFLAMWAKANGADLLSEDGMTSNLEDPAIAEALQFTVDLINAQGGRDAFLNFRGTWDFFGAENQFAANQVGAHPMEQWYLNVLAGSSPEAPISVQPFVDREGNGVTLEGGAALAVTQASTNPDAACAFVTAMAETEAWVEAVEERVRIREEEGSPNTGTFPANREANEQIFAEVVDLDALPEQFREAVNTVLENQENAFAIPAGPANGPIFFGDNSIVAQAVARVLDGEDAAEVLQQADEEAQAAIDAAAAGQ